MEKLDNFELFSRVNPLDNFLFYKLFGEKGSETQLLGFLNAVLSRAGEFSGKEPIKSVDILENKSFLKDFENDKSCILDILAVLHDGTKVNIEVQIRNEHNMDRRSLFYWSKLYSRSLSEGQDYMELPNVIAINLLDYNYPAKGGFHTCFHLREDTDPSIILNAALEIHFISMVKWRKQRKKDIQNDPLHRWLTWLDDSSPPELLEEVENMDIVLKTASEKKALLVATDWEIQDYIRRREKYELDKLSMLNNARRKGEQIGEKKGEKKNALKVARKSLAKGATPEFVHEITELDPAIIEKLAAAQKNKGSKYGNKVKNSK